MYDVIIAGAGPAGMTAALNCRREGKSVLVLESESFGGQIAYSPRVENYPSTRVIAGSEFADKLYEQITDWGAEVELERVEKIVKEPFLFKVTTDYGEHECKSVILATGVKNRLIGVDRELELVGKGVSYCALCDGAFYAGEEVALIGDANTALQYAMLLANYCPRVHVCTLFNRFFGDKTLVDAVLAKDNIKVYHNLSLKEFIGDKELSGLRFENTKNGEDFKLDVKAVFISIGHVPNNKAFENLVKLDKEGYIISDEDMKTSCEGVFTAGDCRNKKIRQVVTATSDGAIAAFNCCRYIDSL